MDGMEPEHLPEVPPRTWNQDSRNNSIPKPTKILSGSHSSHALYGSHATHVIPGSNSNPVLGGSNSACDVHPGNYLHSRPKLNSSNSSERSGDGGDDISPPPVPSRTTSQRSSSDHLYHTLEYKQGESGLSLSSHHGSHLTMEDEQFGGGEGGGEGELAKEIQLLFDDPRYVQLWVDEPYHLDNSSDLRGTRERWRSTPALTTNRVLGGGSGGGGGAGQHRRSLAESENTKPNIYS